jgi:transcriptional regulator with XRE-family HTH domain
MRADRQVVGLRDSRACALLQANAIGHLAPPVSTGRTSIGGLLRKQADFRHGLRSSTVCGRMLCAAADLEGFEELASVSTNPSFASRLRVLIAERNVTRSQVAEAAKSKLRTVTDWVSGKTEPSASRVALLCDFFRVSADFMLGRCDAESGLTPGLVVIDEDAVASAKADPIGRYVFAWRVPRRSRVVDPEEATKIAQQVDEERRRSQ